MRTRHLLAALLAGLMSLAAVACEGGTATDGTDDPGIIEPGADPGADLPEDTGEQDF